MPNWTDYSLFGKTHLVDNRISDDVPAITHKENGADDWSLIKNQIFLGLLGSCVSPRKDVTPLIDDCTHAGVRFVYFSPRNMRRSKELASQMGIDVAWNCAISLRPLDEGEEKDEHRMTSDYADWNVKARLPHVSLIICVDFGFRFAYSFSYII